MIRLIVRVLIALVKFLAALCGVIFGVYLFILSAFCPSEYMLNVLVLLGSLVLIGGGIFHALTALTNVRRSVG